MTLPFGTMRRCLLYSLYALLLVALLLYVRFPRQRFKTYCSQMLTQQLPGYENSIESLHYRFPLTLMARKLQLQSTAKAAKDTFDIDRLAVTPDLSAPGKKFSIAVTAYGGTHKFVLVLDRAHDSFSLPAITINNLDLAQLAWLKTQTGRTITGLFSAHGSYSGKIGQDMATGTGEGAAQLTTGAFELLEPVLTLKTVDIEKGEAALKLQEQKLFLSKGTFSGKELKGTFAGQLAALSTTVPAMEFNLTGILTPAPSLIKKGGQPPGKQGAITFPFQLKGTVGKPVFLFDSKNG